MARKILHTVIHTPDFGGGRVLGIHLFGGDGYLWRAGIWTFGDKRPHRLLYFNLSGMSIYIRLNNKRMADKQGFGKPLKWFAIDWGAMNINKHRLWGHGYKR